MRKRSKRGITLVELAICCAITLLLGGACLTVLLSGRGMFDKGAQTADTMLETDIFQTFMMQQLPSATSITQTESDGVLQSETCSYLAVEDGGVTLHRGSNVIRLTTIRDCRYAVIPAGLPASDSARAQFVYTLYFKDGTSLSGGFVMAGIRYEEAALGDSGALLSERPVFLRSEPSVHGFLS